MNSYVTAHLSNINVEVLSVNRAIFLAKTKNMIRNAVKIGCYDQTFRDFVRVRLPRDPPCPGYCLCGRHGCYRLRNRSSSCFWL